MRVLDAEAAEIAESPQHVAAYGARDESTNITLPIQALIRAISDCQWIARGHDVEALPGASCMIGIPFDLMQASASRQIN